MYLFMEKILLKNILVDGRDCDVLIEDTVISRISDGGTIEDAGAQCISCGGRKVAIPGFVNMHTHAGMAMMRGIGEDMAFHDWLTRIWEIEKNIDAEYVYQATRIACLEMIKTGTTTFNDQYWFSPMAYKAASEMGIRSVLSYVICDRNDPAESERQKAQCE